MIYSDNQDIPNAMEPFTSKVLYSPFVGKETKKIKVSYEDDSKTRKPKVSVREGD